MAEASTSRVLDHKAKEIVFNTSEYFRKEQLGHFIDRTAEATGVSCSTVSRVRREKRDSGDLSSPVRKKRGPYKGIDDFDRTVIRNKVKEFYIARKQLPTLKSLHAALVEDADFPGCDKTLHKILKELGFSWKKTKDNRKVLIERPNIVALRLAFYRRKKELEDRGMELVYIDETWVDTAYTTKKCWQSDDIGGIIAPLNRGQRIIVVHAGSCNGFVPGSQLVYKARSTTGDYHSEMDGKNFTKWLETQLLPNLQKPSAIVMDNASYHSMKEDKAPNSSTRKKDIQDWLQRHGVAYTEQMLRPELLQLARLHRPEPVYTIDQLVRRHGHEVLRLPPYHPDFNAIELIWSQLKDYVRHNNTTFRYDDVLQLTKDGFEVINADRWRRACDHVDKTVAKSKADDCYVDDAFDRFVINLAEDSSSSSDSDE